jgi:hypothetical protein
MAGVASTCSSRVLSRRWGLDISKMLTPSKAPFYNIVPGNVATPIGSVTLPVTFGTKENYRTEYISFKVANFESSYYAILDRPALAKFKAVPHYVYLVLKMPSKTGVLTFHDDLKKLYDRDQEAIKYTSTTRVPEPSSLSLHGCATALSVRDGYSSYTPIEEAGPVNGEAQHQRRRCEDDPTPRG